MEREMEQQEKRLQEILIKRFIVTLIVVGIFEYILTTMLDRFVMPYIADVFFSGQEVSKAFSTLAAGRYFAGIILSGVLNLITGVFPEPVGFTARTFSANLISSMENSFFISGEGAVLNDMSFSGKLLMGAIILVMLIILALPYIIAAVRFVMVTMREFRRIGAIRMQARKDYEKRRNLMISDIAHDLRTPITTISGYAQALNDGLVRDEDKRAYLEAIRDKSRGMNDLIQLLFDYTRLDSEGFALKKEKTDICEAVRECAASLYTDAESAGMRMDVDIPDKKIVVELDRAQFGRVINNLMVNAIKHNDEGCKIGIFVYEDGGRLNIAVADKGKPIPGDIAGHIFEPFFMGDESRNSRGGSGLGLSVAKKITDMHGYKLKLIQGQDINRYPQLKGYNKAFVIRVSL